MICIYGEELLASCPTPKLEGHPLSAARDCLFNIFAATLHIGSHSSIYNLRMHHAVVRETHLQQWVISLINDKFVYFISLINEIYKVGMEYILLDKEGRGLKKRDREKQMFPA